jgi:hypothetical protein
MSNLRKPNGAKISGLKSAGGKKMAEKESVSGVFENAANLSAKLLNVEGVKKFAAWYIDTAERVANKAIDFQEFATDWAKETPLGPILEAQLEYGKKMVESSANAARSLWRLEQSRL